MLSLKPKSIHLEMGKLAEPNGSKSWWFHNRFAGKPKMISLCVYPTFTLADARSRRFDSLGWVPISEVCNMVWKDVDLEKGTIYRRENKTGVERYVKLSDYVIGFLKVLRLTSDKYLFLSQATKKLI